MKVKEESEKAGLKLSIQRTKIMASGPITSRQIDGEKVETVTDFIFLVSKLTVDGDCSHKIKTCLLLRMKVVTNLNNVLKSIDTTLPTKVSLVKAMVLPLVMWWLRWLRVCLQCEGPVFDPWVRKIPWRRKWQPTPVFLPEKSYRQRSLEDYSPWGCKEVDTTQ